MPDPTSPGGEWQHVPNPGPVNSPVPSAYPSAGNVYAQGGGYPPPPQGNYPPPGGYPPPQGNYPPPPGGYPPPGAPPQGTGLTPNSAAAIAYLTIIPAIIFLVMEPYKQNPLIRFHSFQSLALNVLAFVLWILLFVVNMVVHLVLPAGFALMFSFVFLLLDLVIWLGLFIMWLLAIIKASKGEWYKLPLIGAFCDKQARTA